MWNINKLEKVITHGHVEFKLSRNSNQMWTLRDIQVVNLPTEMPHSDVKFWSTVCCCPSGIQCTGTSTNIIQIIQEYKMISVALLSTWRHWLKIWQCHLQHVPKCSTSKIIAPFKLKVLHFTVTLLEPIYHKYCIQFYKTTRTLQLEQEMHSTGTSGTERFTLGRMIFWNQTAWLHYTKQQL